MKTHLTFLITLLVLGLALLAAPDRSHGADLWLQPGPGTVMSHVEDQGGTAMYIVQLQAPPLASYRGELAGIAATNPEARGDTRLNVESAASTAYLAYLEQYQSDFLAAAGTSLGRALAPAFQYRYAYNGLALELSAEEALVVSGLPGVKRVQREFTRYPLTDAGPEWIGAPAVWNGSGGGAGTMGGGVVVGVIDTGVNHDHPSFADVGGDGYDHTNPRGQFYGLCDPVLGAPFCNDKLIGVWDFTGTSPEDDNQHGSHTASTAVGNMVQAEIVAPTLTVNRQLSGVAPHANLITYKACIPAGCVARTLVAAIDQATADGVDVINYSIGGGPNNPWGDADSQAFLGARDAGVFVATSAGNDGPGAETVGSPANAPWVASIGASTHNRAFVNALVDMSGGATQPPANIDGKSFTSGYGPAPIVHAADYGDGQCLNAFTPGTWDGEIVICDRGTIPRLTKCDNVATGGAGGCVLSNTAVDGESTVADPHSIPAVHIGYSAAQALEAWVRDGGSGHTATIAGTTANEDPANGDVMAGFSSRGANAPVPSVIKPDVTAPGVDVLAAIHTTNPLAGPEYGTLSGTSMSSPHSAGAAALVRALHPDWSPAEVQSALMTTAYTDNVRKEDGVTAADPFDMGAGRVDLNQAGRAGFVLHETAANYTNANPEAGGDPSTLNIASLGHGDCSGGCTWTRTIRSTAATAVTWQVSTAAPDGLAVTISPASFTLQPGESLTIFFEADVRGLNVGRWAFGEIVFTPDSSAVAAAHFPLAVLPGGEPQLVAIEADADAGSHVTQFTSAIDVQQLATSIYGLTPGQVASRQLEQDPTPLEPYDNAVGTFYITVDVPAGSRYIVTEIVDTTSTDLDLFVGLDANGDGPEAAEQVCSSASETAFESCKVLDPQGGVYWIMVQNWLTGQGLDDVTLEAVVIPGADAGNMTVTGPGAPVAAETPFDVTIAWDEPAMAAGDVWYGLADLHSAPDAPANVGALLVKITRVEDGDPPPPEPVIAEATGGGWLPSEQGKKANFNFDIASTGDGPSGELKFYDKAVEVKVHVDTITAVGEVSGACGGIAAGPQSLEFSGEGDFNGAPASFRICLEDNGDPGKDSDRFYLECTTGCRYDSASSTGGALLGGGNIELSKETADDGGADSAGEPSTMALDPLLQSQALLGSIHRLEVRVYDGAQEPVSGAEVTLRQVAADGTVTTLTALSSLAGVATFDVAVLNQPLEFIAVSGDAESNTIYLEPLLQ